MQEVVVEPVLLVVLGPVWSRLWLLMVVVVMWNWSWWTRHTCRYEIDNELK